jgi:4-amino-4-deoxy-L-arabinose transferase-like glycosyltransferase
MRKKNFSKFSLFLILILAFFLRFYKINIPLADHHSWRQADTAAVARNFIKEGFDFLRPRIDNMTPLHSPDLPNPERLFLAEPPIYNSLVALVYSVFGIKDSLARLVTIAFSLGSIIFLFLLVSQFFGQAIALWASFFFAVLPYSIFYGRVILPELTMVFFSLGMLYFFRLWLGKKTKLSFVLAVVFSGLALSQKAFPFFLALPMAYWLFKNWGLKFLKEKKAVFLLLIYIFLSLSPIFLWRFWISRFPEGIPPYDWLFNQGGIRFRPAFFRWIFVERIAKLILGIWGLPLFLLGLALRPKKGPGWFFHLWFLAFLIYSTVFAAGNVTHDYYQVPFIPIAAVFLSLGTNFLLSGLPQRLFSKALSRLIFLSCLVFMLGCGWYQIRDFYLIQGGVDLAGKAVNQLTPSGALVLTGDSNDATLLYNCNRYGWTGGYASYFPNLPESIERVKSLGAEYYVTTKISSLTDSEFGQYLLANFKVISQTDQYIVFDLR